MRLHFISLVPIEFYTPKRLRDVERGLLNNGVLAPEEGGVAPVFSELTSNKGRFYKMPNAQRDLMVAMHESSACVYMSSVYEDWAINRESVLAILKERNQLHEKILSAASDNPIGDLMSGIRQFAKSEEWSSPDLNYVFSFFVIEKSGETLPSEDILAMVEPSLIDADDMVSSTPNFDTDISKNLKRDYAESLTDVDISNNAETYISWATVVSIVEPGLLDKTKDLLVALECRLQIVWNRCYSISKYTNDVFDKEITPDDIDELYWNFAKLFDDAKSVLTATYSSRADGLFVEMIRTSKLTNEIDRVEKKINLLEKHIDQRNAKRARKYQKAIEILLFATAVASLTELFLPLPLTVLPEPANYAIIGLFFLLGIYVIIKNK